MKLYVRALQSSNYKTKYLATNEKMMCNINSNILYEEMSTTYELEWSYHKEKNPAQFSLSDAVPWETEET